MATIASLFGPSAEEIVYARKKEDEDYERKRAAARYAGAGEGLGVFGWAAKAGADTGESLRGMFGKNIEDPLISKYNRINQILNEEGGDLNDPAVLKRVADRLQAEGFSNEAVNLFDRSSSLSTTKRQLDIAEGKMTQLSRYFVDVNGQPVMENQTAGTFFYPDGTPLSSNQVMRFEEWNHPISRKEAIDRINANASAKPASADDFIPVGLYTEDGKNLIQGGKTGLDAALDNRVKIEAAQKEEKKANRVGLPVSDDDVVSDVEEIRRREAQRMGGTTDPSYVSPNNVVKEGRSLMDSRQPYTFEDGLINPGMLTDPRRRSQEDIVIPPWDIRYQNKF